MKSLNETIKEGETKKRTLEETLDSLQEEVTHLFGCLCICNTSNNEFLQLNQIYGRK